MVHLTTHSTNRLSLCPPMPSEMCPKPERSWSDLAMHSEVEEFAEPEVGLFSILTESPDENQRWVSYTFPVDHHITSFQHKNKQYKIQIGENRLEVVLKCLKWE